MKFTVKKQLGLEKSSSLVQPISVGRGLLLTVSFNKVVIFRFEECNRIRKSDTYISLFYQFHTTI